MAGAAGLEPVTSAVTGQRSNQLSYAPARGIGRLKEVRRGVKFWFRPGVSNIRAADAKVVGVGNPAEETCCHPNQSNVTLLQRFVNKVQKKSLANSWRCFAKIEKRGAIFCFALPLAK